MPSSEKAVLVLGEAPKHCSANKLLNDFSVE